MKVIHSIKEIPTHMSEDEAADFWSTHKMSEELLEANMVEDDEDLPDRTRSISISLRLDADLLMRIRKLAKLKHKGYQSVIKDFIVERAYEEEKKYTQVAEHENIEA
jgi:hypothetical protein